MLPSPPPITDGSHVANAKPEPDLLLASAAQLGVAPEGCWYVGDSTWDMTASVRAKMIAIGVTTGAVGAAELFARRGDGRRGEPDGTARGVAQGAGPCGDGALMPRAAPSESRPEVDFERAGPNRHGRRGTLVSLRRGVARCRPHERAASCPASVRTIAAGITPTRRASTTASSPAYSPARRSSPDHRLRGISCVEGRQVDVGDVRPHVVRVRLSAPVCSGGLGGRVAATGYVTLRLRTCSAAPHKGTLPRRGRERLPGPRRTPDASSTARPSARRRTAPTARLAVGIGQELFDDGTRDRPAQQALDAPQLFDFVG